MRRIRLRSLLRVKYRIVRLDPLTVSRRQAAGFYSGLNEAAASAIAPLLPKHSVVFDIGANSGFFTWELCRHSDNPLNVTLFEPIPNLMRIARDVVGDFPDSEFQFVNAALGDSTGEISLFIPSDGNIGWVTSIAEKATSQTTIQVPIFDIRPYLVKHRPNFIKIDVEGSEAPLLERISNLISDSYRPLIYCEVAWGTGAPTWPKTITALAKFNELGYQFSTLDQSTSKFSVPWSFDQIKVLNETKDFLLSP